MRKAAGGFTLIEVLAAFAVLGLGIAIVVSLLNGGRRQVRYAAEASYAAQYAQTLLDAQSLMSRVREGVKEGESEDERVRWRLEIEEIDDPWAVDSEAGGAAGAGLDAGAEPDGDAAAGGDGKADAEGGAGNGGDGGDGGGAAGTAPEKPALGIGFGPLEQVVEPLQLMRLQLDLEWGSGGPRQRARFTTLRTQFRPAGDDDEDREEP